MQPYVILEKENSLRSYGICDLTLTKPFIDLNKIKIEKYDDKLKLYYDGKRMKKTKTILKGENGTIYIYTQNFNSVAIKIPDNKKIFKEEILFFKKYLPDECNHHLIPYKIIDDYIIMQEANGSLDEITLSDRLKIKIILKITEVLKCFYEEKIIYTDIRKENILYKCDGTNIIIYLGDINAFSLEGDQFTNCILTPPEDKNKKHYRVTIKSLLYNLGIFIAELYDANFKHIKNNKNIPDNIKALIICFTEPDPKKRIRYDLDLVEKMINY